ncbi:DUF6387 family protein [Pectobacterium carotovorum]|uniref:DUF6387 family protein n=1 Tax=Pectobacterium TaxID=122277 RepID=UPI00196968AA|nr:DUF6387 family protein [Pectobacterium versatile]MBN3239607.1 hypothetical protein [Pectobacterium versatile]
MVEGVFEALKWFSIDKYDKASRELTYGQWIYLLWSRREFWDFSPDTPPVWNKKFGSIQQNIWEQKKCDYWKFIEQITNGDAINLSKLKLNDSGYCDDTDDYFPGISKINASYLQFLAGNNLIDGMSTDEYLDKIHNNDTKYINTQNRHVIDIEIIDENKQSDLYVEIDLDARDDVIFDGLKKLLSIERHKRGITPVRYLTESDMKKFSNLRLLHYLDVMIFCKAKSLDVNNVILSKILYPDEYEANPVERVRKTMPELAKTVTSEKFLMASEYKFSLK